MSKKVAVNSVSVSDILDMKEGVVDWKNNQYRPKELFQTSDQKMGEYLHMLMAHLLMHGNGDKCWDLLGEPSKMSKKDMSIFIDRIVNTEWFNAVTASGRVYVEVPFEWNSKGTQIKGRYDALWVNHESKTVDLLEFKSTLSSNMNRYENQH